MLRSGVETQDGPRDQRERALRADHQLGEVVTAGRLHELAARGDHFTGPEHRFDAEHVMAGHAVLDGSHTSGIGRHVAPEARRLLAGEDRIDEAVRRQRRVELGEGDPRFDDGDVVVEVDLDDVVHPLEGDDDATVDRDARTGHPGSRAARGERHAPCGRSGHDRRDLRGTGRPHHGTRVADEPAEGFVVGVLFANGGTTIDVGDADDGYEFVLDRTQLGERGGRARCRACSRHGPPSWSAYGATLPTPPLRRFGQSRVCAVPDRATGQITEAARRCR